MVNGQQGTTSKKRKMMGSDLVNLIMQRNFGDTNENPLSNLSQSGPIYPVDNESFILNQKFLSECEEGIWSETNPSGIVPVVVNPELVLGRNGLKLSDEQKEGIQFLWDRYEMQKGGILAHDMGLGKTRTFITLIATLLQQSNRSKGKSSPALKKAIVIAPKNAVSVWKDEFNKWCSDDICKVVVILSAQKDGWDVIKGFKRSNSFYNVMCLSYETFKKYISTFDDGFTKYSEGSIGLVICDEAHKLKNADTQVVKALRKFKGAKLWMGVTGTPYQNNLHELCSLVEFFVRDLEAYSFKNAYCKPINDDLRKFKKLNPTSQNLLMNLRSLLRPALHYKKNSFNIEIHEVILNVALDGHPDYFQLNPDSPASEQTQHKMYELISESVKSTSEITFQVKSSYLDKACIHPEEAYEALKKHPHIFCQAIQHFEENYPEYDDDEERGKYAAQTFSAKIRIATKMVQYIRDKLPDEKIIIVSGSVKLLKRIEGFINAMLNMKCVTYDGEKSDSERERAVSFFENDDEFRVLLLSLKAGGTALTLTRANHLLILEPDFNPANDKQAIGRIYRPGQNRTAFIYRLICTGTLEEVRFIKQLEKESMGNTFSAEDDDVDFNVTAPSGQEHLMYFAQTKSHLNDKLDEMQIAEFNDEDDTEGSNFAFEIKNSKKYREVFEVPDELDVLRGVWDSISYGFHIHRPVDPLTQYLLNDEFEIVDGNICLHSASGSQT